MRLKLYRGTWAVVYRKNGRTVRRSLGTTDLALAQRRFRDLKVEQPTELIAGCVKVYLDDKKEKPSAEAMRASWKALESTFGPLRADQVTRALCREYAELRRKQGRTNGTIIKDLSLLRAALSYCKKAGQAQFEMPPAPPPRERYLTRDEYGRLLDACRLPHIRLFVVLALATGGRASAILELTWDRVDFVAGRIRLGLGEVRAKGRATVPMTETAREALTAAKRIATTPNVIEWAGRPVKSVKKAFAEACTRAALQDVSPHVIRHTAAVWMIQDGARIEEVAQFLGHTDPRLTYRVYARFSPDHLRGAAKALEFKRASR